MVKKVHSASANGLFTPHYQALAILISLSHGSNLFSNQRN